MKSIHEVNAVLNSIDSLKRRAKIALAEGDGKLYNKLMGDLYANECLLVEPTQRLLDEINNDALKAIMEKEGRMIFGSGDDSCPARFQYVWLLFVDYTANMHSDFQLVKIFAVQEHADRYYEERVKHPHFRPPYKVEQWRID